MESANRPNPRVGDPRLRLRREKKNRCGAQAAALFEIRWAYRDETEIGKEGEFDSNFEYFTHFFSLLSRVIVSLEGNPFNPILKKISWCSCFMFFHKWRNSEVIVELSH